MKFSDMKVADVPFDGPPAFWDVVVMWTERGDYALHWTTTDYCPPIRRDGLTLHHGVQTWIPE